MSPSQRPTGDDYHAVLVAAGLSAKCIQGLENIGGSAFVNFDKNYPKPNFQDAIEAVCKMFMEQKKFMKTQSNEDQEKYAAHIEKQKMMEECYVLD